MITPTYSRHEIAVMLNTFHSTGDIISIKRLRNLVTEEKHLYMSYEFNCTIDWIGQAIVVVQAMINADKA